MFGSGGMYSHYGSANNGIELSGSVNVIQAEGRCPLFHGRCNPVNAVAMATWPEALSSSNMSSRKTFMPQPSDAHMK